MIYFTRSKMLYYSKLIIKYKENEKRTWPVIKEAIEKEKNCQQSFPKNLCSKTGNHR